MNVLFVGEAKEIAGAQVAIAARVVANKMADSNGQEEVMNVGVQQIQGLR